MIVADRDIFDERANVDCAKPYPQLTEKVSNVTQNARRDRGGGGGGTKPWLVVNGLLVCRTTSSCCSVEAYQKTPFEFLNKTRNISHSRSLD